jgi:hypothetical protein
MSDAGKSILSATMANEQLKQNDRAIAGRNKYFNAVQARRILGSLLNNPTELQSYQDFYSQTQDPMAQVQQAPMVAADPSLTPQQRMLPEDVTSAGPMALAKARQF